ncbi:hypothetical protein FEM48_Zijuj01G0176200 [Ziziphus jujuba var. spinosa]|uniref:Two-component response regulator n=1 Tax=Ziziphus jujuba var. spinosa TaxID=714518 RepID=A0A978W2M4_ZIZJJ|nr:hypothetical protein FEM48_Zijuj01G0176200 [Ziziphus jujuba var. spinosa]
MTVEGQRGGFVVEDGATDRFPVGMRVLAVDDDPICLKVLENLLRKCQYHVTTTNQAIEALKMLRENRNKYDLVISDVNMPDMDGFKLLELVGLEMDLPVIMLSAHSDTKLVMKGIIHGACDYLLKPVRIEELKNIWQHVVRRRKSNAKDQNRPPSLNKTSHGTEARKAVATTGNSDEDGKLSRKRRDQNEDEEEYGEDDEYENEDDPATQKKPRVVWSVELHQKFVSAVKQLDLEKAVPKKILDLMNVEGLTRENVASHLQKYRLYLKRLSTVATQQPSMAAALGVKDSTYLHMCSLDGFGDLHTYTGSGRVSSTALMPYSPGGMLGRLNSPAGLNLGGIASSGLVQPGHPQNFSNSFNSLGKLQQSVPASQTSNLFQRIPTSLERNQLQQNKCTAHIGGFNPINNPTGFTLPTNYPDTRVNVGSSSNSLSSTSSNHLILQGSTQSMLSRVASGNHGLASSNPESFDLGISGSSNSLNHNPCSERWQGAVKLSKFQSNALPMSGSFDHGGLHSSNLGISSSSPQIGNNPHDFSSTSVPLGPLEEPRVDVQGEEGLIGNIVQTVNFTQKQWWEEHKQDYNCYLNQTFGSINSLVSANRNLSPLSQSLDQSNAVCSKQIDASLIDQLNGTSSAVHSIVVAESAKDTTMKPNENYSFDPTKLQDGLIQNSYGSLDDIMNSMMERGQNETAIGDAEFGYDAYSLGSCI